MGRYTANLQSFQNCLEMEKKKCLPHLPDTWLNQRYLSCKIMGQPTFTITGKEEEEYCG